MVPRQHRTSANYKFLHALVADLAISQLHTSLLFQYLPGIENAFPMGQEDIDNQIVSGGEL